MGTEDEAARACPLVRTGYAVHAPAALKRFLALLSFLAMLVTAAAQGCGDGSSPDAGPSDSGASDAANDQADLGDASPDAPASDAFVVAAHRGFPQVPNPAGHTMKSPRLVTITASNDAPSVDGTDTAASLQAFSDAVPTSAVWSAVASEYGVGTLSSAVHVTGPSMTGGFTVAQIQAYVGSVIAADAGPVAPDGNTIYLLYLPVGASYSETTDCGYHASYPNKATTMGDQIATGMRCPPNADQETQLGQLTRLASHEIVEAATDPKDEGYNLGQTTAVPWDASVWQGWVADMGHVELADLCEGTRTFEAADGGPDGGWELQRMWSNAAAAAGGDPCVPPYGEPYFQVSVPADWYAVAAGASVTIPIRGWSVEATKEWLIHARVATTNDTAVFGGIFDGGAVLTSEAGIATTGSCYKRFGMNNDTSASLQVTAPAGAAHGDYVVFSLRSFREKPPPSCYPPITEDDYHFWPVGIYVP
jgi:hypothetical protein